MNQKWLDEYDIAPNDYVRNRHKLLLRVKGLHEIAHLLTQPFLRYLDPATEEKDTPIKVGQWKKNMGEAGLCLEDELLGGRLDHSCSPGDSWWTPDKLLLAKDVAGNGREWFKIKDKTVRRVLNLHPSGSDLRQFKIKQDDLQLYNPTTVGKKREKSSFIFDQDQEPTQRLIFTGLGISSVPGNKA